MVLSRFSWPACCLSLNMVFDNVPKKGTLFFVQPVYIVYRPIIGKLKLQIETGGFPTWQN